MNTSTVYSTVADMPNATAAINPPQKSFCKESVINRNLARTGYTTISNSGMKARMSTGFTMCICSGRMVKPQTLPFMCSAWKIHLDP